MLPKLLIASNDYVVVGVIMFFEYRGRREILRAAIRQSEAYISQDRSLKFSRLDEESWSNDVRTIARFEDIVGAWHLKDFDPNLVEICDV